MPIATIESDDARFELGIGGEKLSESTDLAVVVIFCANAAICFQDKGLRILVRVSG